VCVCVCVCVCVNDWITERLDNNLNTKYCRRFDGPINW